MTLIRVYESRSVRYTLRVRRRRRHGRPRGHRKAWAFHEVGMVKAGGPIMDPPLDADSVFINRRFRIPST